MNEKRDLPEEATEFKAPSVGSREKLKPADMETVKKFEAILGKPMSDVAHLLKDLGWDDDLEEFEEVYRDVLLPLYSKLDDKAKKEIKLH